VCRRGSGRVGPVGSAFLSATASDDRVTRVPSGGTRQTGKVEFRLTVRTVRYHHDTRCRTVRYHQPAGSLTSLHSIPRAGHGWCKVVFPTNCPVKWTFKLAALVIGRNERAGHLQVSRCIDCRNKEMHYNVTDRERQPHTFEPLVAMGLRP
jgi:hypothetical protein